jgi:FixJ family two-component response regulator
MTGRILLAVVDDDQSVRESLPDLLRIFGFEARGFVSAEEFLASDSLSATQGMVLDITLPGMSGPELQRELKRRGLAIPIVFITGQSDATIRQQMLDKGAVECLFKPFSDTALLAVLKVAMGIRR